MLGKRAELFIKMVYAETEEDFCRYYNILNGIKAKAHHLLWLKINGVTDQNGRKITKCCYGLMTEEEKKQRKLETARLWRARNKERIKEYNKNYKDKLRGKN